MESSRRPLKTRSKPWAQALARSLARGRVNPNAISTTGLLFAALGAGSLIETTVAASAARTALFITAAVCVQMRLLCNMLDGLVAVEGGLKSRGGDLFNELPDRAEDIAFLASAGMAAHCAALGWACAALAVLTAYVRAFGASLGKEQDFCGPMAKPQRMFFLTLGCLFSAAEISFKQSWHSLTIALWIIALGTLLTSLRRVARLWRQIA